MKQRRRMGVPFWHGRKVMGLMCAGGMKSMIWETEVLGVRITDVAQPNGCPYPRPHQQRRSDMNEMQELIEQLKELNKPRLWDAQDIADYLKLAKSTVQSHVICKPDFPLATKVNGTRRWHPDEVQAWAFKSRESA